MHDLIQAICNHYAFQIPQMLYRNRQNDFENGVNQDTHVGLPFSEPDTLPNQYVHLWLINSGYITENVG